jgi:hypothetical protein
MTVSRELARYSLELVGVQEVRWEGSGTTPAGEYTCFYGKGNENHELGKGFFVHKRIISAFKRVECVNDKMSHIILRGGWFHIIILNVLASIEDKIDSVKDSFSEELERIFNKFLKIPYENFDGRMQCQIRQRRYFNRLLGMKIMIMELE